MYLILIHNINLQPTFWWGKFYGGAAGTVNLSCYCRLRQAHIHCHCLV